MPVYVVLDHFHVHIVHLSFEGFGTESGRLHLLDDIIDNLELEAASRPELQDDQSYYAKRTLVYSLGAEHGLFASLWAAQSDCTD
jgi:m7GpppX diphosphatase